MSRLDTSPNTGFNYMEESDEAYLYEENNINSLKLKNLIEEEYGGGAEYKAMGRKKRDKRKKRKGEEVRRIVNRKVVNLPASDAYVKLIDGEERMCFKYNTKMSESALSTMPKA